MLSSKYRIETKQFPKVLRGKTFQNEFFRVVFHNDVALKNPKCAAVISQKIAKTAVARNATRRVVYEILGSIKEQLPVSYITVFPKQSFYKTNISFQEIKQNLVDICLKK